MSNTVKVQYDPISDEHYIQWDGIDGLGWKPGDTILWEDNEDGSFTLKKENIMDYQEDVTEFMTAADQYVGTKPHLNDDNMKQASLYIDLIDEEFQELCDGFIRRHIRPRLRWQPHPALLASRLPTAVHADAAAPALLASRLPTAVDADAAAPALPAFRLPTAMDADAAAPARPASSIYWWAYAGENIFSSPPSKSFLRCMSTNSCGR